MTVDISCGDTTAHPNELNLRLQGKGGRVCEAEAPFERWLEIFIVYIRGICLHFPAVQQQTHSNGHHQLRSKLHLNYM